MSQDTIAAIATPAGIGGIGIIRISGDRAFSIAHKLAPTLPQSVQSGRLILCRLIAPLTESRRATASLDRAFVVFMSSPRSYTGEDVVELHCHGGPVHLRSILDVVFFYGARPAQPGEFTRRAFLNGKLDLVQAEAIADLIHAKSEAACRLARRHLAGRLSSELTNLQRAVADALTLVEAAIDFSVEEHVYKLDRAELDTTVRDVKGAIERLLDTYDRGRAQRDGIRCVIAGRPNVGKSSLLNRLLSEERVIVSATPGTTRDFVEVDMLIGDCLFTLVDTAGIRERTEEIEAEGVRRSYGQLERADLVIYLMDSSQPIHNEDLSLMLSLDTHGILLWNKVDLPSSSSPPKPPDNWLGPIHTQLTPDGSVDEVFHSIQKAAKRAGLVHLNESLTLSRARHRDALIRAVEYLRNARGASSEGLDIELIALDLRLALDAIGEVLGEVTPDDILGRIFAQFCIGK